MGLHVDVSNLSPEECFQIVGVIAKDIALRKFDQERVRKLRKDFDELRRSITLKSSKRRSLDDNCQICGKMLLKFCCLFSSGERCLSCEHMACSKCRNSLFDLSEEKHYLCFLCVKKRQLKRKCFDWFYEAVELKFKRFGSAKVLRGIYRSQKADSRVSNLLAVTREMTLTTVVYSKARRMSSLKAPSRNTSFISSSPGSSSMSEQEKFEKRKATRSKSTEDLGIIGRGQGEVKPIKPRHRKISAPACFWMEVTPKEADTKPLETMEEKSRGSSEDSDLDAKSATQTMPSPLAEETSFTLKIFGEVKKKIVRRTDSYGKI
ncbi:synaptotagmin-like protein 4 isoform X2 [Rhopilema esculentum]|uniref:synaptotagmin-like protein 4 isoform X2 n=1 Tax=Rhopilema esculentum TaxID=499914 RepID=UPI0031DC0F09